MSIQFARGLLRIADIIFCWFKSSSLYFKPKAVHKNLLVNFGGTRYMADVCASTCTRDICWSILHGSWCMLPWWNNNWLGKKMKCCFTTWINSKESSAWCSMTDEAKDKCLFILIRSAWWWVRANIVTCCPLGTATGTSIHKVAQTWCTIFLICDAL